jgi:multiple sugar transport system substrate-binding protein
MTQRSIAALAVIAMVLVACAGPAPTTQPPATQPPATQPPATGTPAAQTSTPVASAPAATGTPSAEIDCADGATATVTFWHTYNTDGPENQQLLDTVLPAFAVACPNITIDSVVMPYDGLHDQLIAAVAGGGLPDVMRMDIIWTPEFASLGALSELDALPGFAELRDQVLPGPLATNAYQGKYFGIPLDTNCQALVYNTDLVPQAPTTLDELRSIAEGLKDQPDTFGLALGGAGPWNIFPWFWTAGGKVTNDDYTQASGYLDSTESIAALQWLVDMQNDGLLGPSTLGRDPDSWGGFKNANYAMLSDGPWFFPIIGAEMGPNGVAAPLPSGPGGSISVVGGENLVLFSTSTQQQAAWAFAKFMLSPVAQTAMAEVGQLPVTQSGLESDAVTSVDYLAPFVTQLQTAQPRTVVPKWPQIDQILTDAYTAAISGTKTAEQALTEAAVAIDPLLLD